MADRHATVSGSARAIVPAACHKHLATSSLSAVAEAKADAVLITALDETAWLFNMRGGDVDYNPIFVSYGLVTAKEASLFVDAAKARASLIVASGTAYLALHGSCSGPEAELEVKDGSDAPKSGEL